MYDEIDFLPVLVAALGVVLYILCISFLVGP